MRSFGRIAVLTAALSPLGSLPIPAEDVPVRSPVADNALPATPDPSGDIIAFWRELREWRPEQGRIARVEDLTLSRDVGALHLQSGVLALLDFRGSTVAAVFEGAGSFSMEPPIEVERRNVAKALGSPRVEVETERVLILFADSTAAELQRRLDFQPGPLSDDMRDATREAMDVFIGDAEGSISEALVRGLLNEEETGFFRAHLFRDDDRDLYFRFEATAEEEVSFGRRADDGDSFSVLTRFHRREDYGDDGELAPQWATRPVDALHYVVEVDVEGLGSVGVQSRVMIIPNVPGGSWVASSLYFSMDVDSLRWADGRDVVWDRSDDDVSTLWVRLPDDAAAGAPLELTVWYEGDILERTRSGFYYLRTTQAWLPRFGASESTFDLTFRTRDDWPVMSVGTRVARDVDPEDDDIVVSRWVTTRPSSQVTFSVGDFEEYEFPAGQTVPIRIHVAESFHRRLQDAYMSIAERTNGMVNVVRTGTPEGKVHLDIENSLAFFSSAYGPLDFEEYNVAEIPFTHGQAFPGMINLSWVTFEETRKTGEDELFRAHEVAHQWWGIAVSPATYHDRWLAEGLSEFSALWYMHRMRANPIRYFERMQELRERILDARDDARPIWLGSRLGSEYVVTVYSKGAWIFHMLRSLLRNYDTDSEEVFDDLMQTLFTRFNGSSISTEALQAFLEEYLQQDLQWFFDQWVYGSSIPTYRFAYQTTELPTGEVKMTVRVRQEDVPEGFTMPVPVQLVFEGEGTAVVFVRVEGEEVVTELPLLPRVPDAVTFNFMDAVLAEVHEEGW